MEEHKPRLTRLTRNQQVEQQRREAIRLFIEDPTIPRAEIGRRLGVDRTTVSGWISRYEREGEASIATKRAGASERTTPEQRQQVEQELLRGALAHGFPTDLWTLDRIALVFERVTSVRYNPGYVWQLVRDMGWTCQKPEKQAKRRNEAATQHWVKETWPEIKKGAVEQNATLLFVDEASLCLTPTVRRTWAPKGKTPLLKHTASRKRLHLIGAIGCTPTGEECRLLMQAQEVPVETVSFLHFLGEVTEHFPGKVIVVMDNLSAHHSGPVRNYLDEHSDCLSMEYFPSYSPELNPVEYLWSAIKGKDVANLPAADLVDLERAAEQACVRIESDQEVMKGFLRGSSLFAQIPDVPE